MYIRRVFAHFDDIGIFVYQAFKSSIVEHAVKKGTFDKGFGLNRITWIKPSFGWILHRSKYATKHRMDAIAKIKISHKNWLNILSESVPTQFDNKIFKNEFEWQNKLRKADIIHQWDPDREINGIRLERGAIQIGLRGAAIFKYVNEWIISVEDVTSLAKKVNHNIKKNISTYDIVPELKEYTLPENLTKKLGCT